jgi:hypothetical protein
MRFGIIDHNDDTGRPHVRQVAERLELIEAYDRLGFYAYRDPVSAAFDHRVIEVSDKEHRWDTDIAEPRIGGRVRKLILALAEKAATPARIWARAARSVPAAAHVRRPRAARPSLSPAVNNLLNSAE